MATAVLSVWDRAMTDLQSVVQSLCPIVSAGPGVVSPISAGNVIVQQVEDRLQLPANPWPALILSCQGIAEDDDDGQSDFENDAVVYPIHCFLLNPVPSTNFQLARQDLLFFRQTIQAKLRGLVNYPLLAGTPEVCDIRLKNLDAVPASIAELQTLVSGFTVLAHAWIPRTRGGDGE